MTKREAAIVSAYTGFMIGEFHEMHVYVEKLLSRSVWTHEFANKRLMEEIREKAKNDFCSIKVVDEV